MIKFFNFMMKKHFFHSGFLKLNFFITITSSLAFIIMNDASKEEYVISSFLLLIVLATLSSMIEEVFYKDYYKGSLDFYWVCYEIDVIIFIKFMVFFLFSLFSVILTSVIVYTSLSFEFNDILKIILASIPALMTGAALVIMLGTISVYFENKSNMLSALILPFNIPNLILFSIYMKTNIVGYLYISYGFALIIVPMIYFLSYKLLKDLYNN